MKKQNKKIEKQAKNRVLQGSVISDKMDKTVVVSVSRFVKHPKYAKYYKVNKKYKAHDFDNSCKIGDQVEIIEVKPISKDKHFKVLKK